MRHFLDLHEIAPAELRGILENAKAIKAELKSGVSSELLKGKVLAMIFDKPSTRTRVSFDVGMRQLGGQTLMLTGAEMQLGRGESIGDTARVLSRYVDMIMIRLLNHAEVRELAANASVPLINGLTKLSHPCQAMADIMTFEEHKGAVKGRKLAWVGDSNNVLASLVHASVAFDFAMTIAAPPELKPSDALMRFIRDHKANVTLTHDPVAGVAGADAIVTDCWVSMGDEDEGRRHNLLAPYQVNRALMSKANDKAVFMHCLPAHRGEEVTNEVMDSPQSIVFDEAENRMHAQKAIMAWCMT